ncbi:hypothetical protein CC2G_000135 [Coprinopsis cinerea AmutBmut pab1-1]|nr:hypothetical protein CC2G_000135 [Coprinopsis cinerea AmutBmut pab1-1]
MYDALHRVALVPGLLGRAVRALMESTEDPPAGFMGLPKEILVMIMQNIDMEDVLSLRVCCRLLCDLSKERSVQELPSSGPDTFMVGSPSHPQFKHLAFLPFGHFFVMHSTDGGIWLQSPTTAPQLLIPSPFSGSTCISTFASLDLLSMSVDAETSFDSQLFPLAFNMAVVWERFDYDTYESFIVLQVWELAPQVDNEGTVMGYSSRLLSSFSEEGRMRIRHTSLYGKYIAYAVRSRRHDIAIVDWTDAASGLVRTYVPCVRPQGLFLLPQE